MKLKKGQIFSIDAFIAIGVFIIIMTLAFFLWNYSVNRVDKTTEYENIIQTSLLVNNAIKKDLFNDSLDSLSSLNQEYCKSKGMIDSRMECFILVKLENGSKYTYGYLNYSKQYVKKWKNILLIDENIANVDIGVTFND